MTWKRAYQEFEVLVMVLESLPLKVISGKFRRSLTSDDFSER